MYQTELLWGDVCDVKVTQGKSPQPWDKTPGGSQRALSSYWYWNEQKPPCRLDSSNSGSSSNQHCPQYQEKGGCWAPEVHDSFSLPTLNGSPFQGSRNQVLSLRVSTLFHKQTQNECFSCWKEKEHSILIPDWRSCVCGSSMFGKLRFEMFLKHPNAPFSNRRASRNEKLTSWRRWK